MTTDTDKLEEMLRASGAEPCNSAGTLFTVSLKDATAFRTAIIASLCGDVEPSLYTATVNGAHIIFCDAEPPDDAYDTGTLVRHYPASTVAALKAQVAELEKDAARLEFVCNSPNRMVERESGLWRVYEDVAPTDHPTAVWQGMTPRWHVTPREAIDAAITAALTKGQP